MAVLHALKSNERLDRIDWTKIKKGPIFNIRGFNFADLDIDNLRPNQRQAVFTGTAMDNQRSISESGE